jgi:uncharacterized protein YutE (UPF0331/DUF86 family)
MTPEVLARKLERLKVCLTDLEGHRGRSAAAIRQDPYAVERLLELVVQIALDVVAHLLAERRMTPSSYRAAFQEAGRCGLLPEQLAARLADAAGLRNVLVHMYDEIDYEIVAISIPRALEDFSQFVAALWPRIEGQDQRGP